MIEPTRRRHYFTRLAHFPSRPIHEIGYREVFEKRIGLDDLVAIGPARCIGARHDGRIVAEHSHSFGHGETIYDR